jgi:hypothetical protein
MVALVMCVVAFAVSFLAGRRSLVAGVSAVLAVGYFYGIVRANAPSAFSHFIFDAAVVGLYLTQLFRPTDPEDLGRMRVLRHWLVLLIGWPLLLLLFPVQDPMVQMVGLRAHVFFLPLVLLGARLDRDEVYRIACFLAGLNLVVFGFAVAEFFIGVPAFYPKNDVTQIIYRSTDVRAAGDLFGSFRIPATFAHAAQYGATMSITIPLILGAWVQRRGRSTQGLLVAALAASVLGVFLSASRLNILVLGVLVLASLVSGRMGVAGLVGWVGILAGLGWGISTNERLFLRLLSLDMESVIERLSWSMNQGVFNLVAQYPLGNGLGGGGSSMPHFLLHLIRNPMPVENQYATIMLEQGLPGLLLWIGFLVWVLTRSSARRDDPWHLGRRLAWLACALHVATGFIGVGLFTSVPFSAMLMLWLGWLAVPQRDPAPQVAPARPAARPEMELAYPPA